MSTAYCESLQARVTEEGAALLGTDPDAAEHLTNCTECSAFVDALAELERIFEHAPEHDAPDTLALQTAAAVARLDASVRSRIRRAPLFTGRSARALPGKEQSNDQTTKLLKQLSALAAATGKGFNRGFAPALGIILLVIVSYSSLTFLGEQASRTFNEVGSHLGANDGLAYQAPAPAADYEADALMEEAEMAPPAQYAQAYPGEKRLSNQLQSAPQPVPRAPAPTLLAKPSGSVAGLAQQPHRQRSESAKERVAGKKDEAYGDLVGAFRNDISAAQIEENKAMYDVLYRSTKDLRANERAKDGPSLDELDATGPTAALRSNEYVIQGLHTEGQAAGRRDLARVLGDGGGAGGTLAEPPAEQSPLQQLLASRARIDGLTYKEPAGYWANTYLPGSPELRRLQMSLQQGGIKVHRGAAQPAQPFDVPDDAALKVFLHADKASIEGKNRLLLQVGLQATRRQSGARPALNIGVVLDLRGATDQQTLRRARALLFALNEAKDISDRFSVTIAGRPGATLIEPDTFKHGHLTVAFENLLGGIAARGPSLDLLQALEHTVAKVSDSDDPTAPLGSSSVLLITSQPLGAAERQIRTLAAQSSVAGIPLSVISLPGASREELDELALSGQGSHRRLEPNTDPSKLIDEELSSVGRIVARAVRLKIRLSPGVHLVDVLGSRRLDDRQSEQVRQAEQSIDRRLSRNLGIEADRGDDEEGIQMIIPAYYSGDAHVILLDVVADAPGPLAEVTARYKDLVFLRNGVARTSLSIGSDGAVAGPLEQNVLKNFLAHHISERLDSASQLVRGGDSQGAANHVNETAALLRQASSLPGFAHDAALDADISLLTSYHRMLHAARSPASAAAVADSLECASLLKLAPTSARAPVIKNSKGEMP